MKYLRKSAYKEKRFIWLTILNVLVHDWLISLLWGGSKVRHHDRRIWWRKTTYIMSQGAKESLEEAKVPWSLSGACSQWHKDLPLGPTPKVFTTSQYDCPWHQALNPWAVWKHWRDKLQYLPTFNFCFSILKESHFLSIPESQRVSLQRVSSTWQ
jgi:hypothetical protein